METKEKMEKIMDIVKTKSIHIARVPDSTKNYFINLSDKEFESDYGMTLKFLCDIHKGYFPTGHEEIEAKLDILASEIEELKTKLNNSKKGIKLLSGKQLEVKP